ncbi:hypothetical protein ACFQZ4_07785 [Catellatospora coxensis]
MRVVPATSPAAPVRSESETLSACAMSASWNRLSALRCPFSIRPHWVCEIPASAAACRTE